MPLAEGTTLWIATAPLCSVDWNVRAIRPHSSCVKSAQLRTHYVPEGFKMKGIKTALSPSLALTRSQCF